MASLKSLAVWLLAFHASLVVNADDDEETEEEEVNEILSEISSFDALHGYVPLDPEVKDLANIALDLKAMHHYLKKNTEEGLQEAMKVYKFGGYSLSYATVTLLQGLEDDIPVGTVFTALGQGGQPVTARTEAPFAKGSTELILMYNQDIPCYIGGLSHHLQETNGCFDSPGTFQIGNFQTSYEFKYDKKEGNKNERTIHSLSTNAIRKFRHNGHGNQPYYPEFQKFVDYFGEPDFGDKMISAAEHFGIYEFREGRFDFTQSSAEARGDFIKFFAGYLNIGLFVIEELENSVEKCADHCDGEHCLHAAVHALDGAVAFYTGSLQAEDGNGNLLYGLANEMCYLFRTCGAHGDSVDGPAKVNLDIFEQFKEMQDHLANKRCPEAAKNKDSIIRHMFVPLIQGFEFAVYRRQSTQKWGREYKVEDAAPFSAAILPLLGFCKMPEAKQIQINFAPGDVDMTEDLNAIVEQIDDHLGCMGLCCHDIGGLWNTFTGDYHKNMDPCVDTWESCLVKPEPVVKEESKSSKIFMWVILVASVICGAYFYRRRRQAIKRRKRREAEGYRDEDEDSVDSTDDRAFA